MGRKQKVIEKDTRQAKQPPADAEVIRPDPPGKRPVKKDDKREGLRALRLDVIGTTLDGMDLEDAPIEQDVLEGLLFNIGKLLLEHLEEHRRLQGTAIKEEI